jgi:hypothetical protein
VGDDVWEALQRLIEFAGAQGSHSREDALLVARHRTQLLGQRRADGSSLVLAPGVALQSYVLPDGCTIERCVQRKGLNALRPPVLWAVRSTFGVLSREGEFEYEPLPSSRSEDFLQRCRFDSAQEAFEAWQRYKQAETSPEDPT